MNKPTQRLGDKPEADMIELVGHMRKLSSDLHAVKGNLAANSQMTQMTLDKQIELHGRQDATDKKIDSLATRSEELLIVFEAGKKGVSFLQGLGKWVNKVARWALPVLAFASGVWAILHGQWPGDHK